MGIRTRLAQEPELGANYVQAHERFLANRNEIEHLGTDFSGGGMPERVKRLHVLMAYALAEGAGRGVAARRVRGSGLRPTPSACSSPRASPVRSGWLTSTSKPP